jgi:hypothetical protein
VPRRVAWGAGAGHTQSTGHPQAHPCLQHSINPPSPHCVRDPQGFVLLGESPVVVPQRKRSQYVAAAPPPPAQPQPQPPAPGVRAPPPAQQQPQLVRRTRSRRSSPAVPAPLAGGGGSGKGFAHFASTYREQLRNADVDEAQAIFGMVSLAAASKSTNNNTSKVRAGQSSAAAGGTAAGTPARRPARWPGCQPPPRPAAAVPQAAAVPCSGCQPLTPAAPPPVLPFTRRASRQPSGAGTC